VPFSALQDGAIHFFQKQIHKKRKNLRENHIFHHIKGVKEGDSLKLSAHAFGKPFINGVTF
jgi:hypothetical protein